MSDKKPAVRKADLAKEMIDYIRSGASLLYVLTTDEKSTLEDIQRCVASLNLSKDKVENRNYGYYEWSCTDGVIQGDMKTFEEKDAQFTNYLNGKHETEGIVMQPKAENDNTRDALRALDFFAEPSPTNKRHDFDCHVSILKDMHPQLKDIRVVRKVKDIVIRNDDHNNVIRKCMIIVSPIQNIPLELRNLVTIIDWRLPDREEIRDFLAAYSIDKVVEELGEKKSDKPWRTEYTHDEHDKILTALTGMSLPEIDNVVTVSQVKFGEIQDKFLIQQKKQMILKNGLLEYYETNVPLEEVGGMAELKNWLEMRKPAFTREAMEFGLDTPKGVMLVGPPGCGKSYTAKATANLLGMPLIRFDVGKVFSQTVGSSEANVREVIKIIEAVSPCVVMIDEIEKGLAGVASSNSSDAGTTARVVGTLLSWMNDKTAPAFIVATANNIKQLPPELSRKGRFDDIFFVSLPETSEREETFSIHLKKKGYNPADFDVPQFAKRTKEWSNSECEEAIKSALIYAWNDHLVTKNPAKLTDEHILKAIEHGIPLSKTSTEQMSDLYEWVGFDEEKQDGVRARYASKVMKDTVSKKSGKLGLSFIKASGGKKESGS